MQAFKLYFKIFMNSCLIPTVIYFVVFSALAIVFSKIGSNSNPTSFDTTKYRVAVINNDASEFSGQLEDYVINHSKAVKINTDEDSIRDALFFCDAEYILTIPSGYGDAFLNGENPKLETRSIPDSVAGAFMGLLIDNYLQTFELYLTGTPDMSVQDMGEAVLADLSIATDVKINQKVDTGTLSSSNNYFNYSAYIYMAVVIQAVSMTMLIVNEKDIRRRNLCSPVRPTSFSFQMFAGNGLLCVIFWAMFCIYPAILYGDAIRNTRGLLYSLNSFCFMLVCLALSFLISNVASKKTVSPIMNTVALGCSFLGGAFVPQNLLSDTVKTIAIGNPSFWFIKANNRIGSMLVYDMEALKPVFQEMSILLLFAVAFLSIALVIVKMKRTAD